MEALKPCPFCGNEPTLYQDEMTGHWAVRCVKDNHRPTLLNSHGATAWCYSCTDPAEAIEAWNTRAERTCHKKKHLNLTIGDEFLTQSGWDCSECGGRLDLPVKAFYCPSCGARVIGADE